MKYVGSNSCYTWPLSFLCNSRIMEINCSFSKYRNIHTFDIILDRLIITQIFNICINYCPKWSITWYMNKTIIISIKKLHYKSTLKCTIKYDKIIIKYCIFCYVCVPVCSHSSRNCVCGTLDRFLLCMCVRVSAFIKILWMWVIRSFC